MRDNVKILVPPGLGDVYWVLVKLQAFIEREGLGIPEIYIASPDDNKTQAHLRAFPFIEMFPFIKATWKTIDNYTKDSETGKPMFPMEFWQDAYLSSKQRIWKDVLGCDYFMNYNGAINSALSLDEVDADLSCNWTPPMSVSPEQEEAMHRAVKMHGDYVVFHFSFRGSYSLPGGSISVSEAIYLIKRVSKLFGLTPVIVGGLWDVEDPGITRILNKTKCVDLVGKISLNALFGLIRGAKIVVGHASGLEMVSPMLGTKTLTMWENRHLGMTPWNVVSPQVKNSLYFVDMIDGLKMDYFAGRVGDILAC